MAVSINGSINGTIHGKGDICLKLNPFDNFRLFTLYEDWRSDNPKPLNLSNGQRIYLIFKSKNKEIRIPEYDLVDNEYSPDKVNGEVLFKISKKQSIDILSMDTRVFYITRVYDITDNSGSKVVSSDEEVLYTGQWKDESVNTVDSYSSQLKNLMDIVTERNTQIRDLQESNANLIKSNADYLSSLTLLQEENERLNAEIAALEARLSELDTGNEYEGMVVGDGTHHTVITGRTINGNEYTEEQMAEALKNLEIKVTE